MTVNAERVAELRAAWREDRAEREAWFRAHWRVAVLELVLDVVGHALFGVLLGFALFVWVLVEASGRL